MTTSRRQFLASAISPLIVSAQRRQRPNIVFVLTDDQRWNTLGCMGDSRIQTPNVDRLGGQGVLFENSFVTTAICCASRASIFSGLHERSHGCVDFATSLHGEDRPNTYYNLLRKAGYRTGFIGKYGVGNAMPEEDFDYWRGFPGQGRSENQRDGKIVHLTRIMTEQALEFLDSRSEEPFCLSISTKAPHADDPDPRQYIPEADLGDLYRDQRIPPPPTFGLRHAENLPEFLRAENTELRKRWRIRFDTDEHFQTMVRNYYRLITGVDRLVGRLTQRLEERGLSRNTVIIYSSDNGYFLGERGWADKWLMYEPSIRTPLVIYDPRVGKMGSRRREMALNIDIAPTILDLAGVEVPAHIQGRSLTPFVSGGLVWRERELFYEHHFTQRTIIPRSEGVRTSDWKYIRYIDAEPLNEQLFRFSRDPNEDRNLIRSDEKQATFMRGRWQRWTEALAGWKRGEPWQDPG
jgi:arylsulfatase A-like enzyme